MKYLVCDWVSLVERRKIRFQAGNRTLLVAAVGDRPYAIADKCPHLGYPLSSGGFEAGIVRCKEHGLEIDVRTGEVANPVKADFLRIGPLDRSVRTFAATVVDGRVYVEV
jgi:nitrite reductase/ring-hydroxylating ferredoxin subunit